MPTPGEHKTVQARILEYAEAIGWTFVSREEAEQRRGFDPDAPPADRAKNRSLFFDDLLDAKVREFNPRCAEAEGALLGQFRHLHTDIYANREFVEHLRNRGKCPDDRADVRFRCQTAHADAFRTTHHEQHLDRGSTSCRACSSGPSIRRGRLGDGLQ